LVLAQWVNPRLNHVVKFAGMGLQSKFVIALLVSAALPFLIALAVFETSGFRYFMDERGRFHHMEAANLVRALDEEADNHGEMLQIWLTAEPALDEFISGKNREASALDRDELARQTRMLDELWPSLPNDDPRLSEVLRNPGARSLQRYLELNSEVAEVLATDAHGRLIAATGKSTDFEQADENWWHEGKALGVRERWTDILRFDASSGVFSQDVVLPMHDNGAFAGVVKISVDVSSLFSRLGSHKIHASERWEIVLADGWILASSEKGFVPLANRIPEHTRNDILRDGRGWILTQDDAGQAWLTGFAALESSEDGHGAHVLFSSLRDDVVEPLQTRFLQIGAVAITFLALCTIAGYRLLRHDVLRPLEALGRAARSISGTARIHPPLSLDMEEIRKQRETAIRDLDVISTIRTGDEIESLSADFAVMSERVLRYHSELEAEVAAKTSVIHDELELARQFQTALLPSRYPEVPPDAAPNPLRLRFAHFYQPAFSVGGDFFDLIELDENRAGILIADVMGHGARSALVTAILRALVRNHTMEAGDPGAFLTEINHHLHEVISRSGQTLFVTAFLLVLDTRLATATWSVAGHPAPLRVRRGSGKLPEPLWNEPHHQPALGLSTRAVYQTHESGLHAGDVFLLYTDGVFEAENPEGGIFGVDRLARSFDEALDGPMAAMPAKIVCDVTAFQRRQNYDDDVCIVAVEAVSRKASA
jgi:serine phosphatase RsbU (regulator of sigma subunit)